MEDLSRSDYPAMLAHLQPMQAAKTLDDRVKRVSRINNEIAEWIAERRRIEDQYVQSLRKLTSFKVPNTGSELGVFQTPWDRILQSTHNIAQAHHHFSIRIEQDVEVPLRALHARKEMQNVNNISGNLAAMARELEDAQTRSEKLSRKGGKAQKVEEAASKLEAASQQWEAQSPFVFETLQALDETRCNQLRDYLTQYLTHESDKAQRTQQDAEEALNIILEVSTEKEIQDYAQHIISGKPKLERRTPSSRPSIGGSSLAPPSVHDDDHHSEHSGRTDPPHSESKLRRLGTMLGRRRQSIHGGFGQLSPQRGARLGSSHGRISPRTSSNNLTDSANRLSALAEQPNSPDSPRPPTTADSHPLPEETNGVTHHDESAELSPTARTMSNPANVIGAETGEKTTGEASTDEKKEGAKTDADGFTVPVVTHDPIAEAEKEAAEANGDAEQFFKVNIQKEPIAEEDPDAKQAALSNVAHTLTAMGMPSRKTGTIRGRRDVRSTIYVAGPDLTAENPFPPSPAISQQSPQHSPQQPAQAFKLPPSLPSTIPAALVSEASIAGTSDTQSVRSGNSLSSVTHFQHPDIHGTGLNGSIIEAVSTTFEGGVAKNVKVIGEIALSYSPSGETDKPERENVRINDFSSLEAVGPNRIFVHPTDIAGEYSIDTAHFSKMTPAFTYKLASDSDSLLHHVPLLMKADWRPQGDKLGLLLQYSLNPECKVEGPLALSNVVVFATYVGRAAGAQLKPSGTHLKERHIVYWRLGDVTLTVGTWDKIVCRIIGAEGGEIKPGHVQARWEHSPLEGSELGSGITLSRLDEGKGKEKAVAELNDDDPFADETPSSPMPPEPQWTNIFCKVKTIGGKYEAR